MSSYTAEATEQVVKIAMQGAEIALRIAGAGAAKIAALLRSLFSDDRKSAGRTRIGNLLKAGEEIRVFTVKDSDLVRFSREAKRYGVSYTVIKDRTAGDGTADILVKIGDAARVNRVIARCGLASEEPASELQLQPAEIPAETPTPVRSAVLTQEEKTEEFLRHVIRRDDTDPIWDRTESSDPSGPFSETRSITEREGNDGRRSVRKELQSIIKALKDDQRAGKIPEIPQPDIGRER